MGKPTGALQYLYLLILVVLEVPAVREVAWVGTAHQVYFAVLAAAITLNCLEIVRMLAPMGAQRQPTEETADG